MLSLPSTQMNVAQRRHSLASSCAIQSYGMRIRYRTEASDTSPSGKIVREQHSFNLRQASTIASVRSLTSHSCAAATSSDVVYRCFGPTDLAAVKRLHKFAKLDGKPVFGADTSGTEEMLEYAANQQSGTFGMVATSSSDATDILAAATAQLDESSHADGTTRPSGTGSILSMVLLTVVVRADHRRGGVAKGLIQALCDWASKQHGVHVVVTDVSAANSPAVTFFTRAGFKTRNTGGKQGSMVELEASVQQLL
mmetsp:Transcript_37446/g.83325  ORF Transcript_37446/g.83325 Transcript_37446/m.83325 type:complete len:253 (+) Transcript_37446:78-836(+)